MLGTPPPYPENAVAVRGALPLPASGPNRHGVTSCSVLVHRELLICGGTPTRPSAEARRIIGMVFGSLHERPTNGAQCSAVRGRATLAKSPYAFDNMCLPLAGLPESTKSAEDRVWRHDPVEVHPERAADSHQRHHGLLIGHRAHPVTGQYLLGRAHRRLRERPAQPAGRYGGPPHARQLHRGLRLRRGGICHRRAERRRHHGYGTRGKKRVQQRCTNLCARPSVMEHHCLVLGKKSRSVTVRRRLLTPCQDRRPITNNSYLKAGRRFN